MKDTFVPNYVFFFMLSFRVCWKCNGLYRSFFEPNLSILKEMKRYLTEYRRWVFLYHNQNWVFLSENCLIDLFSYSRVCRGGEYGIDGMKRLVNQWFGIERKSLIHMQMSTEVVWNVVKNHSAYMKKQKQGCKITMFSTDKMNVLNAYTYLLNVMCYVQSQAYGYLPEACCWCELRRQAHYVEHQVHQAHCEALQDGA